MPYSKDLNSNKNIRNYLLFDTKKFLFLFISDGAKHQSLQMMSFRILRKKNAIETHSIAMIHDTCGLCKIVIAGSCVSVSMRNMFYGINNIAIVLVTTALNPLDIWPHSNKVSFLASVSLP